MATPQTATPTPAPAPRKLTASLGKFQRREYQATQYIWPNLSKGFTREDFLNPDFYVHVAGKLRPSDWIECIAEDNSYYYLVRVIACASTWARTQIIFEAEGDPITADPTPERNLYKVDHISTGWRVIHRDSQKVLASGLPQRDDAERAIDKILEGKTKQ
jgi:hypothetical protein